jgi:nucleoside-diphosphate-sugar epimerase
MKGRVLITGGAGFIGFHLGRRLSADGYSVDLLDNFSRGVRDPELTQLEGQDNVRLVSADLLQAGGLDELGTNYHHIVHFAAIIGVVHVQERPYEVLRDNVAMLDRMIDFARRQSNLKRFLFASTSEVYAGTLQYFDLPVPTPEGTPLALPGLDQPRTSYMLSKLYGEAMCHNSGLPFTIVRPHNLYGPRMGLAHVVPELLKRAYESSDGGELEVFSVDHQRSFCYVDDAVEMLARMLEQPECEGRTLNLGRQDPEVTIREVAEACLSATGKALTIVPRPATPGSPARRAPDMSETTRLIGFEAQVDLAGGIMSTFDWYRQNVFSGNVVSAR